MRNMKTWTYLILVVTMLAWPVLAGAEQIAAQPAPVPTPVPTPIDIIDSGKAAWSAFTAGQWVLGIGLGLNLLIQLFRAPWLGGIVVRIPARWRVAIPLLLSGIASACLALVGEIPAELAALLAPLTAGVAIGVHETGEALRARRERYKGGAVRRAGIGLIVLGLLMGGCTVRPPAAVLAAGGTAPRQSVAAAAGVAVSADDTAPLRAWCRKRQEHRWWSSAIAQATGVLAAGLAATALARGDDRIELGLEVSGLISAAFAAGAQTYSGAQAAAYEQHCGDGPVLLLSPQP